MDRQEHLAWCKQRANEYLDNGDVSGAFASFTSDITKHPETQPLVRVLSLGFAHMDSPADMRHFIDGFN